MSLLPRGPLLEVRLDGEAIGARVAWLAGDEAGIAGRGGQHLHIILIEDGLCCEIAPGGFLR